MEEEGDGASGGSQQRGKGAVENGHDGRDGRGERAGEEGGEGGLRRRHGGSDSRQRKTKAFDGGRRYTREATPAKKQPEKEAEAVALLDEVNEAEEVDGEGSDDDGGGEETATGAEVTGMEIGEEKAGGSAGGKKTEGDEEEEEGREAAAMVVGERKPSWVVGVEMKKEGPWRRDLVHWWRKTEKRGRRGGGRRLRRFRRRGKHRLSRQRGRNDEGGRRKRPRSTTAVIGEDEAVVGDRMWRGGREKESGEEGRRGLLRHDDGEEPGPTATKKQRQLLGKGEEMGRGGDGGGTGERGGVGGGKETKAGGVGREKEEYSLEILVF